VSGDGASSSNSAPEGVKSRSPATLVRALGHDFRDINLVTEALTHRGAAVAGFGNERLEFLGDRVLGLVIADLLYKEFPGEAEGVLARRFTGLVRREALEEVAAALDLGRFLILADADVRTGARENRGLQADACEALIGALYLDGGLAAARDFILAHWRPLVADHGGAGRDAKSRLQEWAQGRGLNLPQYRELARKGPAHEPLFTVEVRVAGLEPAEGVAGSKRAAEQAAAERLLESIDKGQFDG
jgi:ribonuclease-3